MDPVEHAIAEGYVTPDGALTHDGLEALARLEGPFALELVDADGTRVPVTVGEPYFTMTLDSARDGDG